MTPHETLNLVLTLIALAVVFWCGRQSGYADGFDDGVLTRGEE